MIYTPSGKLMVDCLVDGRIYVAVDGNTGSAHPSDAIGKLTAELMMFNEWRSALPHKPFQKQLADDWHAWLTNPNSVWA